MMGIWGLERKFIEKIGVVTFNISCDPAIPKAAEDDRTESNWGLDAANLIITICCAVIAAFGIAIGLYFGI